MSYTYRTDAIYCDTEFDSVDDALAAAIQDGEWAEIDSERERRYIDEGAWLTVYENGVPVYWRGSML